MLHLCLFFFYRLNPEETPFLMNLSKTRECDEACEFFLNSVFLKRQCVIKIRKGELLFRLSYCLLINHLKETSFRFLIN